ncbi:integral membrane protein S linking to the trans Golgi network-domain-containing protein [Dipodascopsis uninucleata]
MRRPRTSRVIDSLAPSRLAKQIIVLQTLYYLTAAVLLIFTCLVSGTAFSLDLLFSWKTIRIDTTIGWTICLVWLLNNVFNVLYLTLFVGRSKLVWDFVLTIHGLNLLFTTLYSHHVPASLVWWVFQLVSIGAMVMLGIWTSRWRELRVMYFSSPATSMSRSAERISPSIDAESYEMVDREALYDSRDDVTTPSSSGNNHLK